MNINKIMAEMDDIEILERYPVDLPEKAKGHRYWGRMSWLYPGDLVCQITGKTAIAINKALQKNQNEN